LLYCGDGDYSYKDTRINRKNYSFIGDVYPLKRLTTQFKHLMKNMHVPKLRTALGDIGAINNH